MENRFSNITDPQELEDAVIDAKYPHTVTQLNALNDPSVSDEEMDRLTEELQINLDQIDLEYSERLTEIYADNKR